MNEMQELPKAAMARTRKTLILLLAGLTIFGLTADFSLFGTPYFFGGIVVGITAAVLLEVVISKMSRIMIAPHIGLFAVAVIFVSTLPEGLETRALILGMSCILWSVAIISQIGLYRSARKLEATVREIEKMRSDIASENKKEGNNQ